MRAILCLSLLWLLLAGGDSPAVWVPINTEGLHVPIEKVARRLNRGGTDCAWNSVTTLCRYHGHKAGFDIDEKHRGNTVPARVSSVLRSLDIPFREVPPGSKDALFLDRWVAKERAGALVGLGGRHAVVCVHFDQAAGIAALIDNMGPYACKVQRMPMREFLAKWDGWAVAILPDTAPWFFPGVGPSGWTFEDSHSESTAVEQAVGMLQVDKSQGSATVIGPMHDGKWHILTAQHCVGEVGSLGTLKLKNGRTIRARTVVADATYDLAWMETDRLHENLPHVQLADADPKPGTEVWHCGYSRSSPSKVRKGTVAPDEFLHRLALRLTVDHGDSGGGLFNEQGRLVGVMTNGVPHNICEGQELPHLIQFGPGPTPLGGPYPSSLAGRVSAAIRLRPYFTPRLPSIKPRPVHSWEM